MTAPRTRSAFDVRSWVFWVGVALFVYGLVEITPLILRSVTGAPLPAAFAAVLWGAYGVILLGLIYRFALYERRPIVTVWMAFAWGSVVAAGMGVVATPASSQLFSDLLPVSDEWASAISAGAVEEPLKLVGLIALALIPGARIRSASDGLFYGVVIGLGFEVTESFLYSTQWDASGTDLTTIAAYLVLRGVIGGLWSHPTYSAIAGAGVGYFFGSTASAIKRWAVMLGGLLAAIALHALFDSPVLEFPDNPVPGSIVKGLPALILALLVLRAVRRRSRVALASQASEVVPDEVVSPADFASLATAKSRRRALKEQRKGHGRKASRALSRVQRAQLDVLVNAHDDGLHSPRTEAAIAELSEAREELSALAGAAPGS